MSSWSIPSPETPIPPTNVRRDDRYRSRKDLDTVSDPRPERADSATGRVGSAGAEQGFSQLFKNEFKLQTCGERTPLCERVGQWAW